MHNDVAEQLLGAPDHLAIGTKAVQYNRFTAQLSHGGAVVQPCSACVVRCTL
jgi:hypothetical protein